MTPHRLPIGYEVPNLGQTLTADALIAILNEAENGDTRNLFALYRDILCDAHIQSEFTKRKAAILADRAALRGNNADPAQVQAVAFLTPVLESQCFVQGVSALLDATLFPISILEKVFAYRNGQYVLADLIPVPMQLLDFSQGEVRIYDVDEQGRPLATSQVPDSNRYIIHAPKLLPMPERWGGPMRAVLSWWLLRTMSRQWWASLLERFGTPFLIGKYQSPDDKTVLTAAFQMAQRIGGLVISKGTEVELVQAAQNDSGTSHGSFIELCNAEISKLIVGQTLSTTPAATGLGSGVAQLQGQVREDLRRMDALFITSTLRDQLFTQLLRLNGFACQTPKLRFGIDSSYEENAAIAMLPSLAQAGLELDDAGLAQLADQTGLSLRRRETAPPLSPLSSSAPALLSTTALGSIPHVMPGAAHGTKSRTERLGELWAEDEDLLRSIIEGSATPEQAKRRLSKWLERHATDAVDLIDDILIRAAESEAL